MRPMPRSLPVVIMCLSLVVSLAGRPQQPQFRANTTLVPVDVRVVDKQGHAVTDLTQADFAITENGKPQEIVTFATQAMVPGAPAPGPITQRARSTDPLTPQQYRVFLLLLGRAGVTGLDSVKKSLSGLEHFVRSDLHPQDYVAVLAYDRVTTFTTDHAAILSLIDRYRKLNHRIEADLTMAETGLRAQFGNSEMFSRTRVDIDQLFGHDPALGVRNVLTPASADFAKIAQERRDTVDALQEASRSGSALDNAIAERRTTDVTLGPPSAVGSGPADIDVYVSTSIRAASDAGNLYAGVEALRNLDGEKHLVLVTLGGIGVGTDESLKNLGRTAADARIVIDVIHTGGFSVSSFERARQSRELAQVTGGRFDANRNRYASKDLDLIDQDSAFKYLLGYRPANPELDGQFRDIRVTVKRPGLTVVNRRGYYAKETPPPTGLRDATAYTRIATAAHFPKEVADLGLDASAKMTRAASLRRPGELTADLHIDLSRVMFEKNDLGLNTATLDVAVFCLDSKRQTIGEMWKFVELTFTDARLEAVREAGVPVQIAVPVTGTVDSVKIVGYQYAADLVGSKNLKLPKR